MWHQGGKCRWKRGLEGGREEKSARGWQEVKEGGMGRTVLWFRGVRGQTGELSLSLGTGKLNLWARGEELQPQP